MCLQNNIKRRKEMKKWLCALISMTRHGCIRLIRKHQKGYAKTKTVFWGEERWWAMLFFSSNSLYVAVLNKNYIIARWINQIKTQTSVSDTSLPQSGAGVCTAAWGVASSHTLALADQRPLSPEHEIWGIFTHSHLTATEGKHKPGIWLPFLPPLFSGFPSCGWP